MESVNTEAEWLKEANISVLNGDCLDSFFCCNMQYWTYPGFQLEIAESNDPELPVRLIIKETEWQCDGEDLDECLRYLATESCILLKEEAENCVGSIKKLAELVHKSIKQIEWRCPPEFNIIGLTTGGVVLGLKEKL